jgi:hypothetical protein
LVRLRTWRVEFQGLCAGIDVLCVVPFRHKHSEAGADRGTASPLPASTLNAFEVQLTEAEVHEGRAFLRGLPG